MKHWGKLLGGLAGLVASRHPIGAALGAALGAAYDEGWLGELHPALAGDGAFIAPLFKLAGAVAKADGRVSQAEVAATEHWFGRMQLAGARREAAIRAFNVGKQPGAEVESAARALDRFCVVQAELRPIVIRLLVDIAAADGSVAAPAGALLHRIATWLGAEPALNDALRARGSGSPARPESPRRAPHEVLGVAPGASAAEVRRAYRRLIAQHHPDKLQARGASRAEIEAAEQAAREINAAYEQLRLLAEGRRR